MSKIEFACQFAEKIANDPQHGYDQSSRWGPNYDCSSLVITAWEQAGVPVKSIGGATYTGNMLNAFLRFGFAIVTDGSLERGDVLLNETYHTALYIGNGKMVEAGGNEFGGITGGKTGDQTGNEIAITQYHNFPWDYILRYKESVLSEPVARDDLDLNPVHMLALEVIRGEWGNEPFRSVALVNAIQSEVNKILKEQ